MAGNLVTVPFVVFHDIVGQPIDGGYIYVGTENVDTVANPISVFWDSDLTIPATQPIRTVNGYPARNGSPGNLYVSESAFSMLVKTVRGSTAFSRASMTSTASGGSENGWLNAKESPFFAVGDGVTDDTVALQAAIDAAFLNGRTLFIPYGIYMVSALSVTVSGAGKGPVKIIGDSAPGALATSGRGTQIKQIAGTTGSLLTLTGDWGSVNNYPIAGVTIHDIGFRQSDACTGWAWDFFNLTNRANDFRNISIYTPYSGSAGGIRMQSCWAHTLDNIELYGPASGTSRGIVIFGTETASVSDGTSNMIVLKNINAQYYGDCNMQLGKWTESGGGFAHAYKVIGGQVGHATKYGLVIGRVLDVDIDTLHTEVNGYSGVLLADDAGGVDPFRIKMRIDSYNDGMSAAADDPDSYAVQVAQGVNVDIDLRTQEARAGIYIADNTSTSGIRIADSTHFGAKTDGTTSRSALYFARTTSADTYTAEVGKYTIGGTWGNGPTDVVSGPFQQRQYVNAVNTITDTDTTIPIYPWTAAVRLAPSGAKTLEGFAMISPYVEMPQQRMRLYFNNSDTTVKDVSSGGASDFRLADGVDWTPRQYDTLDVELRDGEWCEVSRSYNSSRTQTHGNTATMAVAVWTALIYSTTSAPTNVTGFTATGAIPDGFSVKAHFTTANATLVNSASFNLSGGINYAPTADTMMTFTYSNGAWYESGRVST